MTKSNLKIAGSGDNSPLLGNTAPLTNLAILDDLVRRVAEREHHLPGIAVLSGPSGFGKSTAAGWAAAKHQAYYIECRSNWTQKAFLEKLLQQMGIQPKRTISKMVDQASEEMASSQRPIMMDEFDNAVRRNLVELVRDLFEQSKCPVILIGEEKLPQMLTESERFHGRILAFAQAQPADISDARKLAKHYVESIAIADDLLEKLCKVARGSIRRIVVNLDAIDKYAKAERLSEIDLEQWGDRPLFTSQNPAPRSF